MSRPGYSAGFLGTLRNFPFASLEETYKTIGKHERPALIVHGTKDTVVPFEETTTAIRGWMPNIELHAHDDSGHLLQFDPKVRPGLVDFLSR